MYHGIETSYAERRAWLLVENEKRPTRSFAGRPYFHRATALCAHQTVDARLDRERSPQSTPTTNETLVVPEPPIFRVWKFFAPST